MASEDLLGGGGGTDMGQYFDPGMLGGGGGGQMLYDTLTGQFVTPQQAQALDPTFQWGGSGGADTGVTPDQSGGGLLTGATPGTGSSGLGLADIIRMATLGLGLGATGLGAAGIAQQQMRGAPTTSTGVQNQSVSMPGPMSPEQSFLLNNTVNGGIGTLANYNTGQAYPLLDQQSAIISQLYGNAPNADPYLQGLLQNNAYGMAQGQLPALSPQLMSSLDAIYGPQQANIDRYLEDQLTNMRDQMNNQGWEGGTYDVLRQGPGQALMAPALREAVRQRGLLGGQEAQAAVNLAQALPMQAANLGGANLNMGVTANQNQQGIANLYNTPISIRQQTPMNLFNSMQQTRGTGLNTSTQQTATGQQPSLLDAFAPTASLLGGLGGLLNSYGRSQQGATP